MSLSCAQSITTRCSIHELCCSVGTNVPHPPTRCATSLRLLEKSVADVKLQDGGTVAVPLSCEMAPHSWVLGQNFWLIDTNLRARKLPAMRHPCVSAAPGRSSSQLPGPEASTGAATVEFRTSTLGAEKG